MRKSLGATAALLIMLLAGCATTAVPRAGATDDGTPAPATATGNEPAPAATPQGAVDPDVIVIITATGTAANGATLSLEMRLHRSIRFDDIAGQTIPAAIVEACPTTYSTARFAAEKWSFARANISALPGGGEWPTSAAIDLLPSTAFLPIAARGFVTSGTGQTPALPECQGEKSFVGPGNGAIAFGIPGDALDADAAGSFTRWANHRFGFHAPAGVNLSACTVTVTDLGKQYGAETGSWSTVTDATTCSAGAQNETPEL